MIRRASVRGGHLERAIEEALGPGEFIHCWRGGEFVEGLEAVREEIRALVKGQTAARAAVLLETFIAGCYEKTAEVDDSSGNLGMFVQELFCDWIRARQRAKAEPTETGARLLDWMFRDKYGYCLGLEKKAAAVLDKKGRAAFVRALGARPRPEGDSYAQRRTVEILKAVHEAEGDVGSYRAVCEAAGELSPRDCEVLAGMCLERQRPDEALAWAERGLSLEEKDTGRDTGWSLGERKREALMRLGRRDDALASAWEDYRRAPSIFSYRDLMKLVPRGSRREWHEKAMGALEGAEVSSTIELLLETREIERLGGTMERVPLATLSGLSHYTVGPAARRVERSRPVVAAKLYVAMAVRILDARKSRYYDAAVANLSKARGILLREGRAEEWAAIAGEIHEKHRRKASFLAALERPEGGRERVASFLDRARERWGAQRGRP